jgi:uncharacterized metal-binding protein YceD (DUF177 family)
MDEEFSRIIRAGHIKAAEQEYEVVVDKASRAALAVRFGLPGISSLSGVFKLKHERSGIIAATLRMRARVTQRCVVMLEPFEVDVAEDSELRFVPVHHLPEGAEPEEEEEITPESLEGPDEIPYTNDQIDLGSALAEQLALALDPYPRKPGAVLPSEATDNSAHPFSVLASKFGKQG